MKNAVIISCNDNYDYDTRTKYVSKFLKEKGYRVKFIIADFDHRNKVAYYVERDDEIDYIHVREYKKNISFNRIRSHLDFARGVKKQIVNGKYDLIYHCAPPNMTIRVLSKIKENKKFKLITEIGDMWPETMPVSSKVKKIFFLPLKIWSDLRDKYLHNSDEIIAECNLFNSQLRYKTGLKKIKTMYFCKESNFVEMDREYKKNGEINLCYLGSINNIIDCKFIGELVRELACQKKVCVHIIGDGEKRRELIFNIEENGGHTVFYGKIFDEKEKKKIFEKSHYALNIMKKDVNVGMTMKSLDYFSYGIPIINNIGGDIERLVDEENIGFNITEQNIKEIAKKISIIDLESYLRMKNNVRTVHMKYFSIEKFNKEMDTII